LFGIIQTLLLRCTIIMLSTCFLTMADLLLPHPALLARQWSDA